MQTGVALAKSAVPYSALTEDHSRALLVLGDSVAVGVGATKPEDTVAGLLARDLQATYTENNAVSGAQVADLQEQLGRMRLAHYRVILIQIGGNDIIRFHDVDAVTEQLRGVLDQLRDRADHIVLLSMGDVGTTMIFPPVMRPWYTRLSLAYHAAFTVMARVHGATYVNLYTPPADDPSIKDPTRYFAADGLRLTSAGYALWYARLSETVAPQRLR